MENLINSIQVKSIRYYKTNRGLVGYDSEITLKGTKEIIGYIRNDGNGGGTYLEQNLEMMKKFKKYRDLDEFDLEEVLNIYENIH